MKTKEKTMKYMKINKQQTADFTYHLANKYNILKIKKCKYFRGGFYRLVISGFIKIKRKPTKENNLKTKKTENLEH